MMIMMMKTGMWGGGGGGGGSEADIIRGDFRILQFLNQFFKLLVTFKQTFFTA